MKSKILNEAFQYIDDKFLDITDEMAVIKNPKPIRKRFIRKTILIAAVIVLALALAVTVMAYTGFFAWIIDPNRDEDTRHRGEIAQGAIEQSSGIDVALYEETFFSFPRHRRIAPVMRAVAVSRTNARYFSPFPFFAL